jgi:hypothetical protein
VHRVHRYRRAQGGDLAAFFGANVFQETHCCHLTRVRARW